MNIGIDMRPFYIPEMRAGNLYHIDLLHALFRNHPGEIFYLWTTGKRRPKNLPSFEQYTNVKWSHTKISESRLEFWTQSFGYPYIDDIVETQSMKDGHMAWISELNAMMFLAPTLAPIERNCIKIQIVEDCGVLHFPENFSKEVQKIHTLSHYNKQLALADLIFVPSQFVQNDVIKTCAKANKEHITVVGVGMIEDETVEEIEKKTNILEKELFIAHQKEEEKTLLTEILPKKYFFARGIENYLGNIAQVFAAYELFCARFKEDAWELVIEESTKGNMEKMPEIKMLKGIHILPPLSVKERKDVLQKAQAFLYPVLYDGDGIAVIEAMRYRCPVLYSRFGALPEVCKNNGISFNPTSEYSILRAMKKIFRDRGTQKHILDTAEERSHHSRFVWDDIANTIIHRISERIEEKEDEEEE